MDARNLGLFDEESCRFFLREVGLRVVPYYPFSFGMEEVYSLILEKYGHAGIPDVISVLQDLLEDDVSANGSGDDGDIWRSWRHSWRNRNVDSLNPFIPKIGNFVLQRPTSPRTRKVKASNFLQTIFPAESEELSQKQAMVSVIGNARSEPELVQNQETSSKAITFAAKKLNCFSPFPRIYRENSDTVPDDRPRVEVGNVISEIQNSYTRLSQLYPQPAKIGSISSAEDKENESRHYEKSGPMRSRCVSGDLNLILRGGSADFPIPDDPSIWRRPYSLVHSDSDFNIEVDGNASDYPQQQRSSKIESTHSQRFHLSTSQKLGRLSTSITPEPVRNCNVHRQARLINGAIFNLKSGGSSRFDDNSEGKSNQKDESWGLTRSSSLSSGRQNQAKRHSWTGARRIFRSESTIHDCIPHFKLPLKTKPTHYSCNMPDMTPQHRRITRAGSTSSIDIQPPRLALMLDGACDENKSPAKSCVNLNKELPYSPDDIVRSLSSRANISTTSDFHALSYQPLTASTTSSNVSHGSNRRDLHALTQEMFGRDDTKNHELSPVNEYDLDLDPRKYSPQLSPHLSATSTSFSSIAKRNPFSDDPVPLSPVYPPPPLSYDQSKNYQSVKPSIYQSNSCLPYQSSIAKVDDRPRHQGGEYSQSIAHISNHRQSPTHRAAKEYGREPKNVTSPYGVDVELNTSSCNPGDTTKRPQSPIRRVLGFGKAVPAKEIAEVDKTSPGARNNDLGSRKKASLKDWGRKIRYGFLTADEEELEREAQIEQHLGEQQLSSEHSKVQVSLGTSFQSKVLADVEVMISVSANDFLSGEAREGRISVDSLLKTRKAWTLKDRPEVVEFFYDMITQRDLILANIKRVHFHGSFANDMSTIISVFQAWGVMANELSIRTFCTPDSVIRKHLHTAHQVLEMLGAPILTFLAFEELQVAVLGELAKAQKKRIERHQGTNLHTRNLSDPSHNSRIRHRDISNESALGHYQCYADKVQAMKNSPNPGSTIRSRKATGAVGVIMGLPT